MVSIVDSRTLQKKLSLQLIEVSKYEVWLETQYIYETM